MCLVVGLLTRYYGQAGHRWYVGITSYIGWLFPFCIVFLLPIDLTSVGLKGPGIGTPATRF
jgi:hypothetical protein